MGSYGWLIKRCRAVPFLPTLLDLVDPQSKRQNKSQHRKGPQKRLKLRMDVLGYNVISNLVNLTIAAGDGTDILAS
jgi:hypothetical protein